MSEDRDKLLQVMNSLEADYKSGKKKEVKNLPIIRKSKNKI